MNVQNSKKSVLRLGALTAAMLSALAGAASADVQTAKRHVRACSQTAHAAFGACGYEAIDDLYMARANCLNLADQTAVTQCNMDASTARQEQHQECDVQHAGRLDLCEDLGEAPYAPPIDPANFVDPTEIGASITPNPYFLLVPGRTMVYQDGSEIITVEVTDETREILGVTCAVVRDIVIDDGVIIEDTTDWYAQDLAGNVWYFGEIAQNFEDGILVDVEGSWVAGVDSAKPGIAMRAHPAVEDTYRQEFALGTAEDTAEVLSITASATVPAANCVNTCLQTEDSSPIIPDLLEHKFYQPGVGFILEIKPDTGERLELVEIRE